MKANGPPPGPIDPLDLCTTMFPKKIGFSLVVEKTRLSLGDTWGAKA